MPGTVYLVGAGPGDPGLMTRRSLELIASADAILYDRLTPSSALDGARADAEVHYVGKGPRDPSITQEEIHALLLELSRGGRSVVRLKGGDPFVFGRGGEEAQVLVEAGVPFEVVPGVTSGVAAPAYAGIPLTHRGDASAAALVTGNEDPDKSESALNWSALATFPGTLVIYMGVDNLPAIARRLVGAGRPPDEPVALVEWGTLPRQRTITGALADIAERVHEAGLGPPAIVVVGAVARRREPLAWLERRPLFGRRVVVTRARAQASALTEQLGARGAEVVEAPAIRIVPRQVEGQVAEALRQIDEYALICLTSANGVSVLFDGLAAQGRDARALAGACLAVIGPGTAAELASRGIRADVVPERAIAEGLVEALSDTPVAGRRALVARAAEARDVIPEALKARGAAVDVVALYDTVAESLSAEQRSAVLSADYVTFASSSTVRYFVEALGSPELPPSMRVVSIGPVTSQTVRELGLRVHVEALEHDLDGLVKALTADVASAGAGATEAAPTPS